MEYISPSSMMLFYQNRETWYCRYLATIPEPRPPQTAAMAVGSAFDAYVKGWLAKELWGDTGATEMYFDAQVEPALREQAFKDGRAVFEIYKSSGSLLRLLDVLRDSKTKVRFESTVQKDLSMKARDGSVVRVPILGKPDAFFSVCDGDGVEHLVILDWKVNGFYSRAYPKKGYVQLRLANGSHCGPHRDCVGMTVGGLTVNMNHVMEGDWGTQLATYGMLLSKGVSFIGAIHQILKSPQGEFKVAEHCARISPNFVADVSARYAEMWQRIEADWVFDTDTIEESQAKCRHLDVGSGFTQLR